MLVIVFAMITLQNADPTPATTPAASIGQRLTGQASGTGLQGLDTSSPLGDVTITAGCTYGAPRLGPSLFGDASDLTRTFTQPQCADQSAGLLAPLPLNFAAFGPPAGFYTAPLQTPLLHMPASAGVTTTFTLPASPTRSYTLQHLALPQEFNGGVGTTGLQVHASVPATAAATTHTVPLRRTQQPH